MESANSTQQTISVAESMLHWYQSPTNDLETLKNLMPQQVAAEVYCVRGVNFARVFQTYLESPEFGAIQQIFSSKHAVQPARVSAGIHSSPSEKPFQAKEHIQRDLRIRESPM